MRILVRIFAATIFFVLIAAAIITVLETPSGVTPEDESTAPMSATEAIERVAVLNEARARAARISRTESTSVFEIPASEILPPAPELERELRDRLTTQTPIYRSSSAQATLLTRLDDPEEVETGVMILNEDGLWLEVRLNRETYGFVRGADLSGN